MNISLTAQNNSKHETVRLDRDCMICGANAWWLLPVPVTGRSMLSDGWVISESLKKCTCSGCGLVMHVDFENDLHARDIFDSEYSLSAHEPSIGFEGARQKQYANWIQEAVKGKYPGTVLELGCGNGSLLKELMVRFPEAKFIGLEPSDQGVRWAQRAGLPVSRAYISGEDSVGETRADLVVSINVIEHTPQPIEFLRAARAAVNPDGLVVIVCPDASVVGSELLFFDHFFSFCPTNLINLVRNSGLEPIAYHRSPPELPGFQMVVAQLNFSERDAFHFGNDSKWMDLQELQTGRERFMTKWKELDAQLSSAMSQFCSVAVFGAGEMAKLLCAYAPRSWERVNCIVVDTPLEMEFSGRPVVPYSEWEPKDGRILVVAVSPHSLECVVDRLKADGHNTFCLSDCG